MTNTCATFHLSSLSGSCFMAGVENTSPRVSSRAKSPGLKGTSGRKKFSWNERAWKMQKTSHHRPQCDKWFSRYSIPKSGIWAIWTSPFCRFLASIPLKYDVTDAMLQDIKKWKCNTSWVFCLICSKFCRLLEVNKRISLGFKIRCYGNSNENN